MSADSFQLRAARPDLGDGRLFARYLDVAAQGFFRFLLGPGSVEILARAFLEPEHDLSYQNVVFAERERRVRGMASGFTAGQHARALRRDPAHQPLRRAAAGARFRLALVSLVFAPLFRIIDRIEPADFYLQALAVERDCRGSGIGGALMDAMQARARAAGCQRLVLDVAATNQSSRAIYAHRGMVAAERWPKRLPLPGLAFVRMVGPV